MRKEIAELLFPDVSSDLEFFEKKYPPRNLPEGAVVTRFAPSPTGTDVHIGNLFPCLVGSRIAHQSGGLFFLRVEDTDKKREVAGSAEAIISTLKIYGIEFDEGRLSGGLDKGDYGPYLQSERVNIYKAAAKKLVQEGKAYPCFCSEENLSSMRKIQEEKKESHIGYYGNYAECRNLSIEEIKSKLEQKIPFVIRFKSPAKPGDRVIVRDKIRGEIELDDNVNDAIILKSDGIPPYNLAHACDDHFMRVNLILRGQDWFVSTPEHMQLFKACGFPLIEYAHAPQINKLDNGNIRKLSKRKDPEAMMSMYTKLGIPAESVIEYLLTIANSNYEIWRTNNPLTDNKEFKLSFEKLSSSGSLFDLEKLYNISKNIISRMKAEEVYKKVSDWAENYDSHFYQLLTDNRDFSVKMFEIDRYTEKPRKDIVKWEDVFLLYSYFYDEEFKKLNINDFQFDKKFSDKDIKGILMQYAESYSETDTKEDWFEKIKNICKKFGFASETKEYKSSPEKFKGSIGDVCTIIRIALTGRTQTPDLYEICKLLGKNKIRERITANFN